jgi:glutaminyl-tRNA synthetase
MHGFCGGKDLIEGMNPNSLKIIAALVEPSLGVAGVIAAKTNDKFQFERLGYFVADRVDHLAAKPVFNLAVGLKDGWGK